MNATRFTVLSLALSAALTLSPSSGEAGYRPLEVTFTNMTPDAASTDASKACVQTLRDRIAADDANLANLTETPLRKLIDAPDKTKSFLDWTAKQLLPALSERDAFIAVDCRPDEKRLDVLLVNAAKSRVIFRQRGEELNRARLIWFGSELMSHAWSGFTP